MNQLVLSGTATLVLSGTRSSCYRGPESSLRACFSALFSRSNFANQKSSGFLLTDPTTTCDGGDRQRWVVAPAGLHRLHELLAELQARAFQFHAQGGVA